MLYWTSTCPDADLDAVQAEGPCRAYACIVTYTGIKTVLPGVETCQCCSVDNCRSGMLNSCSLCQTAEQNCDENVKLVQPLHISVDGHTNIDIHCHIAA